MTSRAPLRLGLIGMSEGNGHPYSWAAICNGYDERTMEGCGFPVITRYLAERSFPDDLLGTAVVTHIWTQDRARSKHIAQASLIGTVVDAPSDMIGAVDGLLLARDDAQNHAEYALPFLSAGLPVYIDKPLALSVSAASRLFAAQRYPGQLFSCTALHYAQELKLSESDRQAIGPIRHIHATTPKRWDTYAIHAIEPALLLAPDRGEIAWLENGPAQSSARTLNVGYSSGLEMAVTAFEHAASPISLRVVGKKGWRDLVFSDSFSAFRAALSEFASSAIEKRPAIAQDFTLEAIRILEAGRPNWQGQF